MKVLLGNIVGGIIVVTLESGHSIDIIFSDVVSPMLFDFFIRNVKITILNYDGIEELRRDFMHTSISVEGQRLKIDFASEVRIGNSHRKIIPPEKPIMLGYSAVLMNGGKIIKKFTIKKNFILEC